MSEEGGCAFCGRRWSLLRRLGIEWAVVEYEKNRGQFVLCVPCWDAATVSERLAAHMWACDEAVRNGYGRGDPGHREVIAAAVQRGRSQAMNHCPGMPRIDS